MLRAHNGCPNSSRVDDGVLQERGTPNMMLRNASLLSQYRDQPIHLTVGRANFSVALSTDQEVQQKVAVF